MIVQQIKIRPYSQQDWQAVCLIHDAARPIEMEGSCDPRAFVPLASDKDDIADLNQSQKFVAEVNHELVGFSGVNGQEISWLYVNPEYFGNGIGRALLEAALNVVHDNPYLFVFNNNKAAIQLYSLYGFKSELEYETNCNGYPCTCIKLSRPNREYD